MLHDAMNAPTVAECNKAIDAIVEAYEEKYPKATKSLVDGRDKLITHFDFPASHWKHLRTTNPIESTFATVKLRQRVTKGAGSRAAGLAMVFKLMLAAQRTWRRINGYELLPLVRAHVAFRDGVRVERADSTSNTKVTPTKTRTQKTKTNVAEQDAA
jgi:putative transposase